MSDYIKIDSLDNEIQVGLLESILNERNIPYRIRSFHDTAYDGLFQVQLGWGTIHAPVEYKDEILEILADIRKSSMDTDEFPDNP